jgi:hypothetical protein
VALLDTAALLQLHGSDVEVPGQYATAPVDVEPLPGRHVRLLAVLPSVSIVVTPAGTQRKVGMLGDDGRRYHYALQASAAGSTGAAAAVRTDMRLGQAAALANVLLARHADARSRRLAFSWQAPLPLSSKVRTAAGAGAAAAAASQAPPATLASEGCLTQPLCPLLILA